jgi:NAD(P)-dependent dehydrogenase (short-subunit alcohol dehydrogenase family)
VKASFQDRTILITGAGREPGQSIARAFAACGGHVAAQDLAPVHFDPVESHDSRQIGSLHSYVFDLAKKIPVQTLIIQVTEDLGPIEILINALAVSPRGGLLSLDEWDWEASLALNLKAPFLTAQTIGREMVARRTGVIVNLIQFRNPGETGPAYAASQGGLLELSRHNALELGELGVRMHAVCLGQPPAGDMAGDPQRLIDSLASAGWPQPKDAIDWTLALCSPALQAFQGQVVFSDVPREVQVA